MEKKELTREEWDALISYGKSVASSKEKSGDLKFATVCNIVAGCNLAAGNLFGWGLLTLISVVPMVVHKYRR